MSSNPFADLTRKRRWRARLLRTTERFLRPLRPSRIDPDRTGPANLLLVGVDTLRADHLGCYGYSRPTSANLDRLGAQGVVFTDVTAPSSWTLPSFAGALTGLMPGVHGAYLDGDPRNMDEQPPRRLDQQVRTLAQHLGSLGYRTAAFYSNQFFAFGLAESFGEHHYENLPAEELVARAQDWIRRHADRPFFCFILCNDPHEPTLPRPADMEPFTEVKDQAVLRSLVRWGETDGLQLGQATLPLTAAVEKALEIKLALYDATIRRVDQAVGDLARQLDSWGLARKTLVSVFADHGEEFLDHLTWALKWDHDPRSVRGVGHGHSLFQELIKVPWLAWGPGVPAGMRHEEPVSLLDLSPTLLDWLGLPPLRSVSEGLALDEGAAGLLLPGLVGRSLAPTVAKAPTVDQPPRLLLSESLAYGPDLVALRRGPWKLISERRGRTLALFDLENDPAETRDLASERPEITAELRKFLTTWNDSGTGATSGGTDGTSAGNWDQLDQTVRQRLKDLGYTD